MAGRSNGGARQAVRQRQLLNKSQKEMQGEEPTRNQESVRKDKAAGERKPGWVTVDQKEKGVSKFCVSWGEEEGWATRGGGEKLGGWELF